MALVPGIADAAAGEQQQGRTQALAARGDDVAGDLAHQRHVRVQPGPDQGVDPLQVRRDRRQHCRERHDSLIIPSLFGSKAGWESIRMYAIIRSGGKQYRVQSGEQLRVEALKADVGASVSLDEVLLVGSGDAVEVGAPFVSGARVKATVVAHGRGEKVRIFKLRRRKHYQKSQGHRQSYTELRIDDIVQDTKE